MGWRERWFGQRQTPQETVATTGVVWQLRVERERAAIGRLNDRLEQTLSPSVPEPALRAIQVALDELLTNVLVHAQQASGPIELKLARSSKVLDITLSYLSDKFDPTTWQAPPGSHSIAESANGGHGIRLVRALMDDFRYEYVDGCNFLHLRKRC